MKKSNLYWLIALIMLIQPACSNKKVDLAKIINERVKSSHLSLIPDKAGSSPSYFCTWSAQNSGADYTGLGDPTVLASDNLTEEAVFGNRGWEKQFPESIKKDLFLSFDVGWDIAGGSVKDEKKFIYGLLEVATDKFPSCKGTPEKKLTKLNQLAKNAGWKGAGIWIAAQTSMDSKGLNPTDREVEQFYNIFYIRSRDLAYCGFSQYGNNVGDMSVVSDGWIAGHQGADEEAFMIT